MFIIHTWEHVSSVHLISLHTPLSTLSFYAKVTGISYVCKYIRTAIVRELSSEFINHSHVSASFLPPYTSASPQQEGSCEHVPSERRCPEGVLRKGQVVSLGKGDFVAG